MGRSDCVPTEDAVQALIDHLVYPLLPVKDFFSPEPPAIDQQERVAKQIHAVVLLYNYYHRKQFPCLEFLDFQSFCKSASIAKPSLLVYMKFMRKSEVMSNMEQLSITEKTIWDACNICTGLDISKDVPNMGSWPVSEVAVLLIDHTKINCFLQFSNITQGVWSLIEEDVDKSFYYQLNASAINITSMNEKSMIGHIGVELLPHEEDALQLLAFSAVKEKTGISEEKLTILERHITYSLSKQKATVRFYLMQYIGASNDKTTEFSLKDVIHSLQGPLLSKDLTVKPVVEYFHLLPYADILSDWLSRQKSVDCLSFSLEQQGIVQAGGASIEGFEISDRSLSTGRSEEILDKKTSSDTCGIIDIKDNVSSCMRRSHGAACRLKIEGKDFPLNYPQQKTLRKNEIKTLENPEDQHVEKGKMSSVVRVSLAQGAGSKDKVYFDGSVEKPYLVEHADPRQSSQTDACNITSSAQGGEAVTDLPLVPMSCNPQSTDKFQLVPMPCDPQSGKQFLAALESKKRDLLGASLRVLQRKQEELHHQRRLLEDEIARCEMNLQTILTEEEDNLTLKFDLIIKACNSLCTSQICPEKLSSYVDQSRPQKNKRRRLSEAILSLRSPCQELDDICCENNWILPRYNILTSFDHGYQASVTIQGPDFECKGDGDPCCDPQEARESAAVHILSKLRSMASQAR